jgi:hypothetical protein
MAFRLKPGRSARKQFARIVRKELERAADEMEQAKDRSAIEAGLTQGYSHARRGMADVKVTPEDDCFHAWRRRVKAH